MDNSATAGQIQSNGIAPVLCEILTDCLRMKVRVSPSTLSSMLEVNFTFQHYLFDLCSHSFSGRCNRSPYWNFAPRDNTPLILG
jgi:hypothetical protein